MIKFKVGDKIKILVGKDKGREGEVERVFPRKSSLLVPGINIYKKHVKGMPGRKGGIYEIPRPLPFSKVALICPKCKKVTRVGFKLIELEKIRVCKKCKREIDGKGVSKK
jgi:large subunit ribosomal protein L24